MGFLLSNVPLNVPLLLPSQPENFSIDFPENSAITVGAPRGHRFDMKAFTTVKGAERNTKGHYVITVMDEFGDVLAISSVPATATVRIWKHDPASLSVRTEQREFRVSDIPPSVIVPPPAKALNARERAEADADAEADHAVTLMRQRRKDFDLNGGL